MSERKHRSASAKKPRCPICSKPTVHDVRPFCSRRCRDVDLGRWFGGTYTASRPLIDEDDLFSTDREGA